MTLPNLTPDFFSAVLATIVVRATAIIACAWLLTRLLRGAAAATRHMVWTAALASLILLPAVSLVLPRWEMPRAAAPAVTSGSMPVTDASDPSTQISRMAPVGHAEHAQLPVPMLDRRGKPPVKALVLIVAWIAGAIFGVGRLSAGWAAARRLVGRAVPMGGDAERMAQELALQLGVSRPVRVRVSDVLTVPVNCGLFRPIILLPVAAHEWTTERLRVVLLHELAHVRRWDYASLIAMETARAMYWMNPLVWLAARRANIELERACDDEVLRAGTQSVEYAEHLYQIAASLAGARTPAGALAMAQPSTLRARVGAILAGRMNRSPIGTRAVVGACSVALAVGVPLSSLRIMGEGRSAAGERASISALSMPDANARMRAAYDLGIRKASRAVAPLGDRLRDADPAVRGMAAWALGSIGSRQAHAPLVAALRDSASYVREMSVLALGALKDREAVDSMAPLLDDPEMGVRGVLSETLRRIGGDKADELLGRLLLLDQSEHVRDMAAWGVRMSAGADAVPWLLQALANDKEPGVRAAAVRNLAQLADPRAFDALANAARHDSVPFVRGAAAWALGSLKDARAAEPLALALTDTVWNVRVAAASALGDTPGPRAVDALIAATRDSVHQVRLTAVEALGVRARN